MKKRRIVIVSLLLIAALALGIGYATLSRELVINSSANLSVNQEDFAILFTDAQSGSNAATASVTANGLGGNYTVTGLSKQGDTVTITYTITNQTADVEAALNKLRETVKGTDTAAIKADTEALQQAFYKLSEKLYAQSGAQGDPTGMGGDPTGSAGDNSDGYYNADFEDKT